MNFGKYFKDIWILFFGMAIASVSFMNGVPFIIAFFGAICFLNVEILPTYIAVLFVFFLKKNLFEALFVGVMMLFFSCVRMKYFLMMEKRKTYFVGIAFILYVLIRAGFFFWSKHEVMWSEMVFEAIFMCALMKIFSYGLETLRNDYATITVDNRATISVLILCSVAYLGIPLTIGNKFVLAEMLGLFGIMLVLYKFGIGLGITWTVVCALIMTQKTGQDYYLMYWIFLSIVSIGLFVLIKGRRLCFGTIYAIVYFVMGIFYFPELLNENGIKSIASALFLFLLLPNIVMVPVEEQIKKGEIGEPSVEWCKLLINRLNHMSAAFKRIQYAFAGESVHGIGFQEVGDLIEHFTEEVECAVPMRKTLEAEIILALSNRDIHVKSMRLQKNKDDRYEIYLTAKVKRGRIVEANVVRKIMEDKLKIKLIVSEESRNIVGYQYGMICLREKPQFVCKTAVRRLSRYEDDISGDNFYVGDIKEGRKLCLIADGMGNGKMAAMESEALVDTLWELLSAGIDNDMSIRIVNAYLSGKNKGEKFTTLDMLLMDLYSGCGRIYKQGAATTYIKRKDWMEMIKSTSLPVGVSEEAICEKCVKKFFDQDLIVMVSDGVLESIIYENKDEYMQNLLREMESDEPEDVVEELKKQIVSLSGRRLKDDATIIACKLVKNL